MQAPVLFPAPVSTAGVPASLSISLRKRFPGYRHAAYLLGALSTVSYTAYPSYKGFFCEIDSKSALYFWQTYPLPGRLANLTPEELQRGLKSAVPNTHRDKARAILECVEADGATHRDYQEARDFITVSLVKDLERQRQALAETEAEIEKMLSAFEFQLTNYNGAVEPE